MHRLNEIAGRLSPAQVKEVEDFAEFLLARRGLLRPDGTGEKRLNRNDVDGMIGMLEGMGGDKSNKELIGEAWDDASAKYDK